MGADVAALYIDPRGPYPKIPGVECYDEARNAEMYAGPWPVVAHPPCGPWGRLKHFAKHDDPALAQHAVHIVREFGGVLEHPADSSLWKAMDLPKPGEPLDAFGGRTVAVNQCDWGHPTRKATWVYMVGVTAPVEMPAPREPTHSICNGRGQRLKSGAVRSRASAAEAKLSPPAFAAWLVELARSAGGR